MSIQVRRKSSGEITAIRFRVDPTGDRPSEQYRGVLSQLPNDDFTRRWMEKKHVFVANSEVLSDAYWITVRPA